MSIAKYRIYIFYAFIPLLLYFIQTKDFVLFHTLVESYTLLVSFFASFVIWKFIKKTKHDFLMIISIAYLVAALLDFFHLLYFNDLLQTGRETSVDFWTASLYIQSFSLVLSALSVGKRINLKLFITLYFLLFSLTTTLIFTMPFPLHYKFTTDITAFKYIGAYMAIFAFASALFLFKQHSISSFKRFKYLYVHILLMMLTEFTFSFYTNPTGTISFIGHILKAVAYYYLYKAVIVSIMERPFGFFLVNLLQHYLNLHDQEKYQQVLLNSIDIYLLVLSREGKIIKVNQKLTEHFHIQEDTLLEENFWQTCLVEENESHRVKQLLNEHSDIQKSWVLDLKVPHDNTITYISWNFTYFFCTRTNQVLTVCTGKDTTELRKKSFYLDRSSNIIEHLPIMVIITDENAIIEYINPEFERITGYNRTELVGEHIGLLKSKKLFNTNYDQMWEALNDKRIWRGVFHNSKKNNDEYTVKNTIFSMQNAQDESYFVAIQEDITNELNIKQMLFENSQLLDAIFNAVPAMIWVKDLHNNIIRTNEKASDFVATSKEEENNFFCSIMPSLYHEDDQEVISSKRPLLNQVRPFYTSSGIKKWIKIDKIPIFDDAYNVSNIIVFAVDITEQKEVEHGLRSKEADALKESQEKTKFLSNISHELKTPMNTVLGYSQILYNEPSVQISHRHRVMLESILTSGHYLMNIINELLDITRIESGKYALNNSDFDLKEFLESLYQIFLLQTNKEHLTLFFEGIPEKPFFIYNDRQKLFNILSNLLTNALKFTEKGGINVLFSLTDEALIFKVEDTGCGIADDVIEMIYSPFYQTEIGKTKGGIGLGLSIVKEYVHLLNADISVTSKIDEGTSFTLKVPLVKSTALQTQKEDFCVLMLDDESHAFDMIKTKINEFGINATILENSPDQLHKIFEFILYKECIVFMSDYNQLDFTRKSIEELLYINPHLNIYLFHKSIESALQFGSRENVFHKTFSSSTGSLFEIINRYTSDKYIKQFAKEQLTPADLELASSTESFEHLIDLAQEGNKSALEDAIIALENTHLQAYLLQLTYDFQFKKIIDYLTQLKAKNDV